MNRIESDVNWSTKSNKQKIQNIMATKENDIIYPIPVVTVCHACTTDAVWG